MLKCKGPWVRTMCVLLFCGSFSAAVLAQSYTLSGKVIDSASHTVPSATVSAKSVTTGQTFTAQTGADGTYSIANLAAGDYLVWALAGELQAPPIRVTLAAAQTTDLTVSPAPKGGEGSQRAATAADSARKS
jgi:hypothetical protein